MDQGDSQVEAGIHGLRAAAARLREPGVDEVFGGVAIPLAEVLSFAADKISNELPMWLREGYVGKLRRPPAVKMEELYSNYLRLAREIVQGETEPSPELFRALLPIRMNAMGDRRAATRLMERIVRMLDSPDRKKALSPTLHKQLRRGDSCTSRKQSFLWEWEAGEYAKQVADAYHKVQSPYRCRRCDCLHLTTT